MRTGRVLALAGVVLPLLLIGGLKFTPFEVEALKPLIGGTPWLAWMYQAFGEAGASYVLGVSRSRRRCCSSPRRGRPAPAWSAARSAGSPSS